MVRKELLASNFLIIHSEEGDGATSPSFTKRYMPIAPYRASL